MDECFQTLRNALMVVVIDLQKDDDPQVIFETLNARGEPLLPADLLRNYIFFRANREGLVIEDAYEKYWSHFDDEFWREEVKQGRLTRPRSDLFMQHFLASHQGQDIPIKHLYVEYRHWLERARPFPDVTTELATLARQGGDFRRILTPAPDDVIYGLCTFLEAYDIRTAYPLLLAFIDAKGSGKTAVFVRASEDLKGTRSNIVLDLNPESYQLGKLKDLVLTNAPDGLRVRKPRFVSSALSLKTSFQSGSSKCFWDSGAT